MYGYTAVTGTSGGCRRRLLHRAFEEGLGDPAAQLLAAGAFLAFPVDLVAVDGDAEAALRLIDVELPGDADIALIVDAPGSAVARAAVVLVARDTAGQEVHVERIAGRAGAGQGVALHHRDELSAPHRLRSSRGGVHYGQDRQRDEQGVRLHGLSRDDCDAVSLALGGKSCNQVLRSDRRPHCAAGLR